MLNLGKEGMQASAMFLPLSPLECVGRRGFSCVRTHKVRKGKEEEDDSAKKKDAQK